jgi:YbgC/YbaW family acyl-CoA thioester hydrolase
VSWRPYTRDELVEAPSGPHRHSLVVRFQDVDAAGVIFFSRAFEYFSDALFSGLARFGYAGTRMLEDATYVTPVKHAEARYLSPLRFGECVEVTIVRALLRESDFTLGYRAERMPGRAPAVVGTVHQVCVSTQTFERVTLPEELRETLSKLAGLRDAGDQ